MKTKKSKKKAADPMVLGPMTPFDPKDPYVLAAHIELWPDDEFGIGCECNETFGGGTRAAVAVGWENHGYLAYPAWECPTCSKKR